MSVCLQALALLFPLSFHGIRAWFRLEVEGKAQEAKQASLALERFLGFRGHNLAEDFRRSSGGNLENRATQGSRRANAGLQPKIVDQVVLSNLSFWFAVIQVTDCKIRPSEGKRSEIAKIVRF